MKAFEDHFFRMHAMAMEYHTLPQYYNYTGQQYRRSTDSSYKQDLLL